MLKSFSIDNYRCYSEEVTFEFDCNIGAIFGSNASGKTNALKALEDTISIIKNRAGLENNQQIRLYQASNKEKPVSVKLIFENNNKILEYSLSVNGTQVLSESFSEAGTDNVLFNSKLHFGERIISFKIGRDIEPQIKDFFSKYLLFNNTLASFLFTTKLGEANEDIKMLFDFIEETRIFYTTNHNFDELITEDLLEHIESGNGIKSDIIKYTRYADPTIENLSVNENNRIICIHQDGRESDLIYNESLGTKKVIYMTSILARMQKKENFICFFDELDVHFHPVILALWLKDIREKYKQSQIIFTAHNPMILDYLKSWKAIDTIDDINLLYRDTEHIVRITRVGDFIKENELDINNKFSNLLFDYWLQYIPNLTTTLWSSKGKNDSNSSKQ